MKTRPLITLSKNSESFLVIPSLSLNFFKGKRIKIYQIGLCWGFWTFNLGIGFNLPKDYPLYELKTEF